MSIFGGVALSKAHKSDVRTQFGALCYRIKNERVQFLLVTSRRTGRWIIPKGWPIAGHAPLDTAATEAWEEAGARGKVAPRPLGIFSYFKSMGAQEDLPCVVMVYAMRVKKLEKDFPEAKERRRKWVSRKKAANLVDNAELARLVREFDPRHAR